MRLDLCVNVTKLHMVTRSKEDGGNLNISKKALKLFQPVRYVDSVEGARPSMIAR